jgi:hypothetical protein
LAARHERSGLLRRLLLFAAKAVVVLYLVIDAIFAPIFRPLFRWITKLRYVVRLQEMVAALPPYGVLVALAIPFAFAEPAKLVALVLIAAGHVVTGVIMTAMAHLVTLVVVERIYHAGREKLRSIPWFARLMDWLTEIRDRLLTWAKATWVWAFAAKVKRSARAAFAKLRLRFHFGQLL